MADIPNTPSIAAIVMMGLAVVFVIVVVIPLFIIYFKRRKPVALTIAMTFTFWNLGAIAVFVGSILQYIHTPVLGEIQYSRYGINLGYAFSAISNILMVFFVSQIFSQYPLFRRTQKLIPLINAILNGITIGMIINTITDSFPPKVISEVFNPAYPIPQTIYHLVLTFAAFIILLVFSARALNLASFLWEKAGFGFIIASAVFGILIYISFALDLVLQDFFPIFSEGYTIFNILGWLFAIFMANFAYFGYFMPTGLRNFFKKMEAK